MRRYIDNSTEQAPHLANLFFLFVHLFFSSFFLSFFAIQLYLTQETKRHKMSDALGICFGIFVFMAERANLMPTISNSNAHFTHIYIDVYFLFGVIAVIQYDASFKYRKRNECLLWRDNKKMPEPLVQHLMLILTVKWFMRINFI